MKLASIVIGASLYFLMRGLRRPSYFLLGYIWLAYLYPQGFLPPAFRSLPFPLIFGVLAGLGYVILDRRRPPQPTIVFVLLLLLAVWVTCTTFFWAEVPDAAEHKWSWAIKSFAISLAMPFLLRTRAEIEAGLAAIFCGMFAHVTTAAGKSLAGGGGYGTLATLIRDNSYMGESSTLAMVAVISLPLGIYIGSYSLCSTTVPFRRISSVIYGLAAAAAVVGTSARTGLVTLAAYVLLAVRSLWKKVVLCASVAVMGYLLLPFMPDWWLSRMRTIETYDTETSAASRLDVWRWTLDYVATHPLGGGFEVYRINGLVRDAVGDLSPRAFHSIYFETLGEHGFLGGGLYLLILAGVLVGSLRLSKRQSDLSWVPPAARTVFTATALFAVGGAFIGVAYQPIAYGLFGVYLSLKQHVLEEHASEPSREVESQSTSAV